MRGEPGEEVVVARPHTRSTDSSFPLEENKKHKQNMAATRLRPYQEYLLSLARKDNMIIVLPTGAGKTLIAVHLMVEALQRHPSKVVVFCWFQFDVK